MAASRLLTSLRVDVTTALFRATEQILRADPVLSGVVKGWQTWEGKPEDKLPPGSTRLPWVQITPPPIGELWWTPESQRGWLVIRIEAHVAGTCADDVMNLWGAIRTALNGSTRARGCEINTQLQSLGATKGFYEFSDPLFDASADPAAEAVFRATGAVRIEYRALASS